MGRAGVDVKAFHQDTLSPGDDVSTREGVVDALIELTRSREIRFVQQHGHLCRECVREVLVDRQE
jgi:hypothetical protein